MLVWTQVPDTLSDVEHDKILRKLKETQSVTEVGDCHQSDKVEADCGHKLVLGRPVLLQRLLPVENLWHRRTTPPLC